MLKMLEGLERDIGRLEDDLGLPRSSRRDPWEDRLERIDREGAGVRMRKPR